MAAIYESRGSLINEGLLRQWAAAKGGILGGALQALSDIPERRAKLQREMDDHKLRVLETEKMMQDLTPQNIANTMAYKRALLEKANQDLAISAEQIKQQAQADQAQLALTQTTAGAFNLAMPDPMAVADATLKVEAHPEFTKNPQLQKNLVLQQAAMIKAAEGKQYQWVPGDGSAPSIVDFSQAASRRVQDVKRQQADPNYVPGQARELSSNELTEFLAKQQAQMNQWRLMQDAIRQTGRETILNKQLSNAKELSILQHSLDVVMPRPGSARRSDASGIMPLAGQFGATVGVAGRWPGMTEPSGPAETVTDVSAAAPEIVPADLLTPLPSESDQSNEDVTAQ